MRIYSNKDTSENLLIECDIFLFAGNESNAFDTSDKVTVCETEMQKNAEQSASDKPVTSTSQLVADMQIEGEVSPLEAVDPISDGNTEFKMCTINVSSIENFALNNKELSLEGTN